jgi:uncharacterized protein DUF6636
MLAGAYAQVVLRIVAIAVFAASVVAVAPARAEPAAQSFFRTPSKNIYCAWLSGPQTLRCDILSGVKPLPPKPASCDFDWGAGYEVKRTGRARILCVSDSVVTSSAKVLRYGQSWSRGGFTCISRVTGLRCRNRSGHGFFLSRQRSYRF